MLYLPVVCLPLMDVMQLQVVSKVRGMLARHALAHCMLALSEPFNVSLKSQYTQNPPHSATNLKMP